MIWGRYCFCNHDSVSGKIFKICRISYSEPLLAGVEVERGRNFRCQRGVETLASLTFNIFGSPFCKVLERNFSQVFIMVKCEH